MKTLLITQLKPNPVGKDRSRSGPLSAAQLAGEWVDIKNTGSYAVDLDQVELNHKAFSPQHLAGQWAVVMVFPKFSLPAGKVVRVHSGQHRELAVIESSDKVGADYHTFSGRDAYVWNNKEGDTAALWDLKEKAFIDSASYDPYPPEGVILTRNGSKLIPALVGALRWNYR